MKIFRLLRLVIALALLGAFFVPRRIVLAISTYTSGFQIQNLSGSTANITITYYNNTSGTVAASVGDTISANGAKTYFPLSSVSSGFNGSVVISSDVPIAAITNVLGDNGAFGASYDGFSSGATAVYAPLIMRGNSGFNTWFNVQNTGSSTATINITYTPGSAGSGMTESSITIPPGAAKTFDQSTSAYAGLGTKFVGSATITSVGGSPQPVVATVMEVGPTTLFAYDGFTGGSTNLAIPLVNANNSGYVTGIQIQNLGGSATNVTLSYTPSVAGTACTETNTINAGASATFAFNAFAVTVAGENCANGARFIGSASVSTNSASQPLVAIVNQLNGSANKGAAYNSFNPASATSQVSLPLIMDRNSNYYTGWSIANVGSDATTVNVVCSGAPETFNSGPLAPGAAYAAIQKDAFVSLPKYVGSCTATASGGTDNKIVAIVNELNSVSAGDAFLVYEGFNN
jgi:hypothetical protein